MRHGERLLVDLPEAVALGHGDLLLLDDGRFVEDRGGRRGSFTTFGRATRGIWPSLPGTSATGISPAAIEADRILILRDHVIKAMLEGLGASVIDVVEAFEPARGAYSGHGHPHRPRSPG